MDRFRYVYTGVDGSAVRRSLDVDASMGEFRDRRLKHEAARKYTVTDDAGVEHNAGMFRDNTADVLEELSDAHNIASIGLRRYMLTAAPSVQMLHRYSDLILKIEEIMGEVAYLREDLPDELKHDLADILREKTPKRIVTLEDVGL